MDTPESLRTAIEDGVKSNFVFDDPEYHFMLEQLWVVMFEATSALRLSTDVPTSILSDKQHSIMMILVNCLVDSQAAVQSLRSGFHRAAALIARGMLENMALAVAIKSDESDAIFNQYKENKYDIPKAISVAKSQYPHLGKIYGVLTNQFAHEPYGMIGRAAVQKDGHTILLLVPPVGREDFLSQFVLMANLGLLVAMLGEAIEWAFANIIKPTVFFEQLDDKNIRTKDNGSKTANLAMAAKLGKLMGERAIASKQTTL